MKRATLVLIWTLLVLTHGVAQHVSNNEKHVSANKSTLLGQPVSSLKGIVVSHTGYTVSYNPDLHDANWVCYLLTREKAKGGEAERSNRFLPDPAIVSETDNEADYAASGFDRGHLAPAADNAWSPQAMKESFYYSNMTPQIPSFNRGIWKKLEDRIRKWAQEYDSLLIVTGPVLKKKLEVMGPHHVAIPQTFYKVVLRLSGGRVNGIGFLLANKGSSATLSSCAVPINQVESLTGIDFYPALTGEEEARVEGQIVLEQWDWGAVKKRK